MSKLFVIMPFGVKRHDGVECGFEDTEQSVMRLVAGVGIVPL